VNHEHDPHTPQHWLRQTSQGDKQAFGDFYSFYLDEIYRYVYFRVHNRQEAEDLTESAFLNAWRYLTADRKKADIGNPRAWIYRIARNTVIDHIRTRKDEAPLEQISGLSQPYSTPENAALNNEQVEQLERHLAAIEPLHQEVIVLRFINQMSHAETAQVLGIKENHVRVLQYRALKQLRECFGSGNTDHEK